jgi:hypothetical protein
MAKNPDKIIKYHPELIRKIFRQKKSYHRQQAKLPIEGKIKTLVELQKIALTIRPSKGKNDTRRVWNI